MDEILKPFVDACPPLLIFLLAACLFMSDGCLPKIGSILLIPIGIIAVIIWLLI